MQVTDERAWWLSRQVLPHEPALRAWLSQRRVAGLDIDDVVQETYARLIQVESIAGIANVRAYVFQTAWSVMVSHVRRSKIVPFQALGDLEHMQISADAYSPETQVADRDELRRLAAAIAQLPGKVRDVFILRRVDGLAQRDVARRLGLSESTVEKHMSRGTKLMMDLILRGGNDGCRASKAWGKKSKESHAEGAEYRADQRDRRRD